MKLLSKLPRTIGRRKGLFLVTLLSVVILQPWLGPQTSAADNDVLRPVAEEIRYEATLSNNSKIGRPLPLTAHWNTGELSGGFNPEYQMAMIEKGHYLLPWFQMPDLKKPLETTYYEEPLKKAASLNLPFVLKGTQWEEQLTLDTKYSSLPAGQNPNVVDTNGNVLPGLCPFSPTAPWAEVGKAWTANSTLTLLQQWYPNPPKVIFLSNNEARRLRWTEVETSQRYLSTYGLTKDADFKRKVVGEGWITRYRYLQDGMRDGLTAKAWKEQASFVGYNAFGPRAFGRWAEWDIYSLHTSGAIEPWPLAWDGASPPTYLDSWSPITDYTVMSPQIEAMNWIFMLNEAYELNPEFWFEISTYDGGPEKLAYFTSLGQTYSPARYGGMIQFQLWLLRPRAVREFRPWTDTVQNAEPYFLPIVEAVDRVHTNSILRKFWRKGQLVVNPAHSHPYDSNVPDNYKAASRWFLLDTNLDPSRPWSLTTELPVFSIALLLGQAPEREWLIYAHSPLAERKDVTVTLPGYGPVKINANPSGTFFHASEKDKVIKSISEVSKSVTAPLNFRAAD